MQLFNTYVGYVLFALWAVALVYILVRAASFAYFRTKLDYFRKVLHKINGE